MKKYSAPFIAGLAVIFIGSFIVTAFNLYDMYPHLDKVFHVSGGFIVAWFFGRYLQDKLTVFTQFERFVILVALGAMIGVFWELGEFSTSIPPLAHHPLLQHYLYIGDLRDTLGDLVADSFGAALYALFSWKR